MGKLTAPNKKLLCDPNIGVLGMNLPRCNKIDCEQDKIRVVNSYISAGSKTTQYVTAESGNKQ